MDYFIIPNTGVNLESVKEAIRNVLSQELPNSHKITFVLANRNVNVLDELCEIQGFSEKAKHDKSHILKTDMGKIEFNIINTDTLDNRNCFENVIFIFCLKNRIDQFLKRYNPKYIAIVPWRNEDIAKIKQLLENHK